MVVSIVSNATEKRIGTNQASGGASRSPSVSSGDGASGFCKQNGIVFLAFAPLGHGIRPGPPEDLVISRIAGQTGKTPAQVLLAWAVQRGGACLTTPKTEARARENFDVSALPADAFDEINRIQTRQRFNEVVKTGSGAFLS